MPSVKFFQIKEKVLDLTHHTEWMYTVRQSVKCICPMVATTKQNGHRHIMQQVNTTCDILSSSFCLNGRYGAREKRGKEAAIKFMTFKKD